MAKPADTTTSRRPEPADSTAPSLILAMHARYEATFLEHDAVDGLTVGIDDAELNCQVSTALEANIREATLIRYAVLHQVPQTREEACILAFHVAGQFRTMGGDSKEWLTYDYDSLIVGIETLFDFTVSEGDADIEIGGQFRTLALRCFNHRQFRTGQAETIEPAGVTGHV